MPSGLLADHGCAGCAVTCSSAARRRRLGFDNREALFPIHRACASRCSRRPPAASTSRPAGARSGCDRRRRWTTCPTGAVPGAVRIPMTLVRRFSGEAGGPGAPARARSRDPGARPRRRRRSAATTAGAPASAASSTRPMIAAHFGAAGLPVLEGKLHRAVQVRVERGRGSSSTGRGAARLLGGARSSIVRGSAIARSPSSTNRLTLIAAVIPAGVVTTHTIFCLRTPRDERAALVPLRHLQQLRRELPRAAARRHARAGRGRSTSCRCPSCRGIRGASRGSCRCARAAASGTRRRAPSSRRAARSRTGSTSDDFAHVLGTFPLVPEAEREAALDAFRRGGMRYSSATSCPITASPSTSESASDVTPARLPAKPSTRFRSA